MVNIPAAEQAQDFAVRSIPQAVLAGAACRARATSMGSTRSLLSGPEWDLLRGGQSVERASIFKSNESQALRLPKPVAYPDTVKQVDIVIRGRARIITPAGESWDTWFDGEGVHDGFMESREQLGNQKCDSP